MGKFWSKQASNYRLDNGEVAVALYRSILVIDDSQDSSGSILEGLRTGDLVGMAPEGAVDQGKKFVDTGDSVGGAEDESKLLESENSGTHHGKEDSKKSSKKDSSGKSTRNR